MNTISLIRGDTKEFEIGIAYDDGTPYELQPTDKLVFSVKRNAYEKEPLIRKQLITTTLYIDHSDTQNLDFGVYKYDIQLTQLDGSVTTIITPSDFIVEEGITDE